MAGAFIKKTAKKFAGFTFVLPVVIGFVFLFLPAMAQSLVYSFNNAQPNPAGGVLMEFVGWENYHRALNVDVSFLRTLIEILTQMAVNLPIILIFSFLIANLLNQSFKGRGFIRMVFFIPVVIGSGVIAQLSSGEMMVVLYGAEQSSGLGMQMLNIGSLISFYGSLGLGSLLDYIIIAIDRLYFVLISSGVQIVIFISGLQSIPVSLYEASKVEGCSGWEAFWKITLPIISPLILVNAVYTTIDVFLDPRNQLTEIIRNTMFFRGMFGYGASMTWLYFGSASVVLVLIALFISKLVVYYES